MGFTSVVKVRSIAMCFALVAITVAGCSDASHPRVKVKGRVKFFDKYLNAGTVSFISKDGKAVGSANIDSDGNYDMTDAPVGEVTITVKVPTMGRMSKGADAPKNVPPKGLPPMSPGGQNEGAFTPPSFDPSKIIQIPGKYGAADTSGLTYTVEKGGPHTKDITLSP